MFITRTTARRMLRDATGLSEAKCTAEIGKLAVVQDGSRYKVTESDVQSLINTFNAPVKLDIGVKPLSARHRALILTSSLVGKRGRSGLTERTSGLASGPAQPEI